MESAIGVGMTMYPTYPHRVYHDTPGELSPNYILEYNAGYVLRSKVTGWYLMVDGVTIRFSSQAEAERFSGLLR